MSARNIVALLALAFTTACSSAPATSDTPTVVCADEAACRSACDAGDAAACARADVLAPLADESPEGRALRLCDAGTAASCYEAGVANTDPARAFGLFDKACSAGNGDGCAAAGEMQRDGKGRVADPAAAAKLFEKGCTIGSGKACEALALQVEGGQGVPQDAARALGLHRDACAKRDPAACFALGNRLERANPAGPASPAAAEAYRSGCSLGHAAACFRAGQLAESGTPANTAEAFEWYVSGWNGGDKDATLAASRLRLTTNVAFAKDPAEWDRKLFEAACALDDQAACVELGWRLRTGNAADQARAAKLGEDGCLRGIASGCNLAGLVASGVAGDLTRAEGLFQKGCVGGSKDACANQGLVLAQCVKNGPCDAKRGKALLQTACADRIDFACRELAGILRKGNAADRAAATAMLDRSCELGSAESCYAAGVDAKARPAARTYFERACTLGDQPGCFAFVAMLEAGEGGAADPAKAATLMTQQCQPTPKAQWGDACNGWCTKHSDVAFCR